MESTGNDKELVHELEDLYDDQKQIMNYIVKRFFEWTNRKITCKKIGKGIGIQKAQNGIRNFQISKNDYLWSCRHWKKCSD